MFENKIKSTDQYFGRDEFSNSVIVNSKESLVGKIKDIGILHYNQNSLFGKVILDLKQKDCAA